MQIKKVLALLITAVFLTASITYMAFSPTYDLSFVTVIEPGSIISESSYIVFLDGSTYFAKNGLTGAIEFSDSRFSVLMNETMTELRTDGNGKITIKSGVYYTDDEINVTGGIVIEGEGRGIIDTLDTNTIIYQTVDEPIFNIMGVSNDSGRHYTQIKQMRLDGDWNANSSAIIDIITSGNHIADVFLEGLNIMKGLYGVRILENTGTYEIWNIFIEDCFMENHLAAGLFVGSTAAGSGVKQSRFTNNHFWHTCLTSGNGALEINGTMNRGGIVAFNTFEEEYRNGIYMSGAAHHWTIANNIIIDSGYSLPSGGSGGSYAGINLTNVDYNSITGNVCANIESAGGNDNSKYGIYEDGDSSLNTIVGNTCGLVDTDGVNSSGANSVVASNVENPDP